jgi:hypothetical protein
MRNNMTDHHKDQLLDALMYRVGPDIRGAVMREVPAAYNAYVGREVVEVVKADKV